MKLFSRIQFFSIIVHIISLGLGDDTKINPFSPRPIGIYGANPSTVRTITFFSTQPSSYQSPIVVTKPKASRSSTSYGSSSYSTPRDKLPSFSHKSSSYSGSNKGSSYGVPSSSISTIYRKINIPPLVAASTHSTTPSNRNTFSKKISSFSTSSTKKPFLSLPKRKNPINTSLKKRPSSFNHDKSPTSIPVYKDPAFLGSSFEDFFNSGPDYDKISMPKNSEEFFFSGENYNDHPHDKSSFEDFSYPDTNFDDPFPSTLNHDDHFLKPNFEDFPIKGEGFGSSGLKSNFGGSSSKHSFGGSSSRPYLGSSSTKPLLESSSIKQNFGNSFTKANFGSSSSSNGNSFSKLKFGNSFSKPNFENKFSSTKSRDSSIIKQSSSSFSKLNAGPPTISSVIQRNPLSVVKKSLKGSSSNKGQAYATDSPRYDYGYQIINNYGTNFGANEARDGKSTIGAYHVQLPDGRLQTVSYKVADKYSGFVANVKYSGKARFDTQSASTKGYGSPN